MNGLLLPVDNLYGWPVDEQCSHSDDQIRVLYRFASAYWRKKKSETRMIASVLKQDPNTRAKILISSLLQVSFMFAMLLIKLMSVALLMSDSGRTYMSIFACCTAHMFCC